MKLGKVLLIGGILLIGLGIILSHHHPKPAPVQPPCSGSQACIELLVDGKVKAKLNDFRFDGKCIWYKPLPGTAWDYYCGDYKLNWIGPQP